MKTKIPHFFYGFVVCFALLFSYSVQAQIDYSENFNSGNGGWSEDDGFETLSDAACEGSSLMGNFYNFFGAVNAETISPSIGASNNDEAILSYQYQLIDYYTFDPYPNSPDWGNFTIAYSTSPEGPWTVIETVSPSNHTVSANCATRTVSFTPPTADDLYLRVLTDVSTNFVDLYVSIDNVSVSQVTCDGAPEASSAVASADEACLNESVTLSLSPSYTIGGLDYQWQYSTDGVEYSDVETGGNESTYTTTQPVATWYRAVISCSAGGDEVISDPVQVESTGLVCYCEVEFADGVEPITLVEFAGIENETSATVDGTPELEDFTDLDPAEVTVGETYTAYFEGNTAGNYESSFIVYIDFNQNGNFNDEGESFEMSAIINSNGQDGQQSTGEITIPENAMTGITRMRVYKNYFDSEEPTLPEFPLGPCGGENNGFGQAEDYLINISADGVLELGYVNLQFPGSAEINEGETVTVYAQAWGEGVTEAAGAADGLDVWIGVGDEDTDPETWTTWIPATFNTQAGNNDEFMADIGDDLEPGTYYYASRFQLNGEEFVYGGYTSEGGGFWDGTDNVSGVLTVNCITQAPTANAEQEFCNGSMVSELQADGENVLWYGDEEGGSPFIDEDVLVDGIYYASQTIDGCESEERTEVMIMINVVPIPEGEGEQSLDIPGSTLNNIVVVTEGALQWYASIEDYENGNPLDPETPLTDGTTYYATQTVNDCESEPFAVTVSDTLSSKGFDAGSFTYYPNPVTDALTLSYSDNITGVEVYNLLGQLVLTQSVNQKEVNVNMAKLSTGPYLVKVSSENATITIKVIKQ